MYGVCFVVQEVTISEAHMEQNNLRVQAGQLISHVRQGCRQAFLEQSPRLMLAMYSCEIQATSTDLMPSEYWV